MADGGAEARQTLGTGKAAVDEGSCGDLPAPVNSPCLRVVFPVVNRPNADRWEVRGLRGPPPVRPA